MEQMEQYLNLDLDGRISRAQWAYEQADELRYWGGSNVMGYIGNQFCGFLSDFIGEMTCMDYDEDLRYDISEDLYETAFAHYEEYAPLLDGEEVA